MFNVIKNLLKSNKGDGYIVYILFLLIFFIMVGVVMSILTIRVTTTQIYNEVENSADMVISAMKEESYQYLINGTTEGSFLPYSTSENDRNKKFLENISELLANNNVDENGNSYDKLNITGPESEDYYFEKYNNKNVLIYRISDISSDYDDSSGLIEMRFSILIPMRINGRHMFDINRIFTKETSFNFKDYKDHTV